MTRKELYAVIQQNNWSEAVKARYGNNYTRISNAQLEQFVQMYAPKPKKCNCKAKPKAKAKDNIVDKTSKAVIKFLSILQARFMITAEEAEEIANLMK